MKEVSKRRQKYLTLANFTKSCVHMKTLLGSPQPWKEPVHQKAPEIKLRETHGWFLPRPALTSTMHTDTHARRGPHDHPFNF